MLDQLPVDVLVHEVLVHCKGWDIFSVSTVNKDPFETLQDSRTVKHLERECVQYVQPHGKVTDADGTVRWYNEGLKHRDGDLPATIYPKGTQQWFKDGLLHRDGDLPAVVRPIGCREWYKEGLKHRDGDLPAVVWVNRIQEWWKEGLRHRDGDLPAIVRPSGSQHWYKNDLLH